MALRMKKSSINNRISRLREYNYDRFLHVDLTRKSRLQVLYLLGKYGKMASTEIRHKMLEISQSRYTYELLEDLHPPQIKRMRLFVWEDFIHSSDIHSDATQLFSLLYPYAEPFWKISKNDMDNIDVKIDEKMITFTYGQDKKIIIDKSGYEPFVRVYYQEKFCIGDSLIVETKKNKSHIYVERIFDGRISYIDLHYGPNNRKVYALNLLGFLLLISNPKIIGEQKIREVISNPDIVEIVPFLKSWEYFDAIGFNVMEELLSIGKMYKHQILNCDSVTLLGFRVTQTYRKRLEDWFHSIESIIYPPENSPKYRSFADYEKLILYKIQVIKWQRFNLLGLLNLVEQDHDYSVDSYSNLHPSATILIPTYRQDYRNRNG